MCLHFDSMDHFNQGLAAAVATEALATAVARARRIDTNARVTVKNMLRWNGAYVRGSYITDKVPVLA